MYLTDKDGHLTKAFRTEKHRILRTKNWSRRDLISFGKIDKLGSVMVANVAQLAHAVIVQFSGVAQSRYLNMR